MKISIKVKLRARESRVKKIDDTHFEVYVKEAPIEGRANQAVANALAKYFEVAPSKIAIIHGHTSRQKCVEIF